jgi:hypothetical protein
MTLAAAAALAAIAGAADTRPLDAQAVRDGHAGRNEIAITAEPIAGGLRYLRGDPSGVRFGAGLTVGPLQGVTIAEAETGDLDEWATLHVLAGFGRGRLRATAGPGVALAIGDDFGALYPSGRLSLEWAAGRLRLGTVVKVLRIAGAYGRGDYWLRWIPVRVGIAFD